MQKIVDIAGGLYVAGGLFLTCKCKHGEGSYLRWREETAFGKQGVFPKVTTRMRQVAMWDWAKWAWNQQRSRYKRNV